jgi:hypothetical protein
VGTLEAEPGNVQTSLPTAPIAALFKGESSKGSKMMRSAPRVMISPAFWALISSGTFPSEEAVMSFFKGCP